MPGSQGSGPGSVGRGLWEAPVEDGGHVACGVEFASGGGCLQVAEWVLSGFGRQGEEVGSQGRPRRLAGESGDELVGLASSSATIWGPTSCSAATWRPSV